MKRLATCLCACLCAFSIVTLLCASSYTYTQPRTSVQTWGYDNVDRTHWNVSPDSGMNVQSKLNGQRTAFELRPTLGTYPSADAATEFVEYLTTGSTWSRMNWSAIVPGPNDTGHYRFGVEHGTGGHHRNLLFAFEGSIGHPAQIPLQMVPAGSVPREVSDATRIVIDNNALPPNATGVWLVNTDANGNWALDRVEVGPPNADGWCNLRVRH